MSATNSHQSADDFIEVFDPEFKYVKEVPSTVVRHLPPARLNITRLVFCRNYVPGELESCSMGDGCKFVHADVDPDSLESHPIHVKYAWRHEDVCTYARLPAGETLRVTAPNNRPPVEEIASERVLVTRGALKRHDSHGPLSHCAHYYFNRMCNRGERCNFVHVVFVDPNVAGDFKRAPARCVVTVPRGPRTLTTRDSPAQAEPARYSKLLHMQAEMSSLEAKRPDVAPTPLSSDSAALAPRFRHNPYSLWEVTVVA